MPIAASAVGLRGGRAISDIAKRHILLRTEFAALTKALSGWCQGAARVLADMILQAEKPILRIARYDNAHNDYVALFNDWRARLEAEQNYRRFYLDKFIRATSEPWIFNSGSGPLEACILAMITAAKAGILPADLVAERKFLVTCINNYTMGLKRNLLFH